MQLEQFGFKLENAYGETMTTEGIAFLFDSNQEDIMQKVRIMWTVMGDYLSR